MTHGQRTFRCVLPALLLAAVGAHGGLPQARSGQGKPPPVLVVQAVYLGASAQVVADTVAAPIEQQVNGVEGMLHMASRCTDDGGYTLAVTFRHGVDVKLARVLVQNRVNLALPILPDVVKRGGVTVEQKPAGVLLLVKVFSPSRRYDTLYLGNYAALQFQQPLSRLPGVTRVICLGRPDQAIRVWLDPTRMASLKLDGADVLRAIEEQNLQVGGGAKKGKAPDEPLVLKVPGREVEPEALENLILKTTPDGRTVRLKDVARVEVTNAPRASDALFNGDAVVLLAVQPTPQARPRELSEALRKELGRLRARLPEGMAIEVAFDSTPNLEAAGRPTAPAYLQLDLTLPSGTARGRTLEVLRRCQAVLRDVGGVQDTLGMTDNPFDSARGRPCILVRLAPPGKRASSPEKITEAIRTRLGKIPEMAVRVRDLSGPGGGPQYGYPLDLAIAGPEADRVRGLAKKLAERLRQGKKLTDVWEDPDATPRPQLSLVIDRAAAKRQGVTTAEISTTLQVYLGSVNDFKHFGRTWQVRVQATPRLRERPEDIRQLKVRNGKGEMIALGELMKVREIQAPAAIDRLDTQPMVHVTANPAPGVTLAEARALIDAAAAEVRKELQLSSEYRLTWLQEPPAPSEPK